jgi:hypothetical protein
VEEEIMGMSLQKSPSLDGFTSYFFHHCWFDVKMDVWDIMEEYQRISRILHALNVTFITLIPKNM